MICKNCGKEFTGAKFCPNCGTKMEERKVKDNFKKPKKPGSKSKDILIVLLAVGAFVFLVIVVIILLVIYNVYFAPV